MLMLLQPAGTATDAVSEDATDAVSVFGKMLMVGFPVEVCLSLSSSYLDAQDICR